MVVCHCTLSRCVSCVQRQRRNVCATEYRLPYWLQVQRTVLPTALGYSTASTFIKRLQSNGTVPVPRRDYNESTYKVEGFWTLLCLVLATPGNQSGASRRELSFTISYSTFDHAFDPASDHAYMNDASFVIRHVTSLSLPPSPRLAVPRLAHCHRHHLHRVRRSQRRPQQRQERGHPPAHSSAWPS